MCTAVLLREFRKLPDLLITSWASHSPLALVTSMPSIATLIQQVSLDEMRARASGRGGGRGTAAGTIAPKAEYCVLLCGVLYEEAAVAVSIEAPKPRSDSDAKHEAAPTLPTALRSKQMGGSEAEGEAAGAARRLVVRVEIPSNGTKLAQIARLLAELELDVTSGSVATNGKLALDVFHVHYRGTLSPDALAARLRVKLHAALQFSTILPGDSIEASRTRPFTIHATASSTSPTSMADATAHVPAAAAADVTTCVSASNNVRLGLLDLRALAALLAAPGHPDCELWLRYLQVRAPDLLASLANAAQSATATTKRTSPPTAERWLSELRGFMLLRWRRSIGGPQLLDGVMMRDLQCGPMLGEGTYGKVFLARHRMLPDRWYAVKQQKLDATSQLGKRRLRYLEREHEVLLLLARESRGKADINLFVQLVTHDQDADCLQLAMTAVLGGELYHIINETGEMSEPEAQFYAANLVVALQHLHSRGIAYRCGGGDGARARDQPVFLHGLRPPLTPAALVRSQMHSPTHMHAYHILACAILTLLCAPASRGAATSRPRTCCSPAASLMPQPAGLFSPTSGWPTGSRTTARDYRRSVARPNSSHPRSVPALPFDCA